MSLEQSLRMCRRRCRWPSTSLRRTSLEPDDSGDVAGTPAPLPGLGEGVVAVARNALRLGLAAIAETSEGL